MSPPPSNVILGLTLLALVLPVAWATDRSDVVRPAPGSGATDRPRVVVSTDIGGTDPDDQQSMVHLLLYADVLEIEGLISSPYGPGRKAHLLEILELYAQDFATLRAHSERYPTPEALRALTRQGETEVAPYSGVRRSTDGSQWIIACARRPDPRPLHLLVWGGIEDLAQALHDAPDILPRLRVYYIGGPNKKWGPHAYQYIADHHPGLWIIEANATYRGWFVGGLQQGEWGHQEFVKRHAAGHGALGNYFASLLRGTLKMGDTPSVAWLLHGHPEDPTQPGWGGQFVRAWNRPHRRFARLPTIADSLELFGILELDLPLGPHAPSAPSLSLVVENQAIPGEPGPEGTIRFRFCPKEAKTYTFTLQGNVPTLNGQRGGLNVVAPSPELAQQPSDRFPCWWTDDPSPDAAQGPHHGARSVNRWREAYLGDFAARLDRCQSPPR